MVFLLHTHNKRKYEIDIWNPKYTTKLVQVRNFITFELKVFQHEERETQSFNADCFYIVSAQTNQRAAPVAHKFVWPRPALNLDSLVRGQELNSLLFLKSPKFSAHASGAWRHSHPLVLIPIWDFYFDISEWHILSVCAGTPALMLHLTNPCDERKVLSLTKPKGKIYKRKSLRNYITFPLVLRGLR